jgi:hypothetical protein
MRRRSSFKFINVALPSHSRAVRGKRLVFLEQKNMHYCKNPSLEELEEIKKAWDLRLLYLVASSFPLGLTIASWPSIPPHTSGPSRPYHDQWIDPTFKVYITYNVNSTV